MKLLFGLIIGAAILAIVVALYCALIIAGRSDDQAEKENIDGDDNEMFWKKQLCPRCKTGKESYELDKHSETCPYIGCWKDGKCQFYVPLEKPSKPGIFKRNMNKATVTSRNF